MNGHLSLSTLPASSPPPGRTAAGIGDALRALAALWRDHLEQRRRIRAFDGLADMNEHLLKDIGASDWSTSRAATWMETKHRTRFEMEVRL
jgi:uncharacterized protein YjiS (DUF1127 family)